MTMSKILTSQLKYSTKAEQCSKLILNQILLTHDHFTCSGHDTLLLSRNLTAKESWVFTALSVCTHLKWPLTEPRYFSLSRSFLFIKVVNWTMPGVSMAEIWRHPLRGRRCPQGITGALALPGRALTNPLPERKIRVSWGEPKSDQMLKIIFKVHT